LPRRRPCRKASSAPARSWSGSSPPLLPFFAEVSHRPAPPSACRWCCAHAALVAAEALAVAVLQPEAHRQIGLAALAGKAVQAPLQVLQQALGLLAVAGQLLAVLLQAAAPSSADWMRWSIALSRARMRSFSVFWFLLSLSAVCSSLRNCLTWATSVATVSRGVSPSMPSAFISSGVSGLALPGGAGLAPRSPENSLMPTNSSTSAIGISSHFRRGYFSWRAPPSAWPAAAAGGRFTVASIGASLGSSDSARPWPRVTR
jgi:hypothetical protein